MLKGLVTWLGSGVTVASYDRNVKFFMIYPLIFSFLFFFHSFSSLFDSGEEEAVVLKMQTLRKTYSDSALREEIQRHLRGATADIVCNISADISLGIIIKIFTIIYMSVKSFDLLMRDSHGADKEEKSIPSFANRTLVQN